MGTRTQILVRGIVQGVGFRPYIYSLASKRELKGKVINNETGVLIDVEGRGVDIEHFIDELRKNPPPLSQVESISRADNLESINFKDFQILPSQSNGDLLAPVAPVASDSGTCRDCLAELFDPANRRYRYPFINCTNCGPRFTIVEGVPYDRARTTMRSFNMCGACRAEYIDPTNRRFHAEPTCCPECGPQVALTPGVSGRLPCAISDVRELLQSGKIVAIKGLGGYHLACDALNEEAVQTLRRRKYRADKPFALMANSVDVIRKYCRVSPAEEEVLLSAERSVVLLERNADAVIPASIAPGVRTLGFMLPYTPLHYLLLENSDGPLVMTSGNISDEPIAYEDSDARERLKNIADYYLLHNRRIHIRTDDSVVRVSPFTVHSAPFTVVLRRSRGYAPAPVKTSFRFEKQILACGAELKNTFCLARDHHAFISHHIGDLENLETLRSFTEGIEHFKNLFHLEPEVIAYDLHPEYLSTKHAIAAKEGDGIETKIGVQHHHAHIASCLADNRIEGEVIGVAMDGLGFGTDGKLWGGEFFVADFQDAERVFHLDYIPMPGGAKAIREPWRMAASYLHRAYGDEFLDLDLPFVRALDRSGWAAMRSMIYAGTNSPETSSMGRLFDALSALLSLRNTVNYEGQAAIELEAIAGRNAVKSYEFTIVDGSIIKAEPVIMSAVDDLLNGVSPAEVSAKFHLGVAGLIARVAAQIRDERKLNRIALSGGVFQNMFLLERTVALLNSDGFEVFTHSRVPANDGGISLGQAAIANAQIAAGRI
jgi:hydrogenase maturation protein HypF